MMWHSGRQICVQTKYFIYNIYLVYMHLFHSLTLVCRLLLQCLFCQLSAGWGQCRCRLGSERHTTVILFLARPENILLRDVRPLCSLWRYKVAPVCYVDWALCQTPFKKKKKKKSLVLGLSAASHSILEAVWPRLTKISQWDMWVMVFLVLRCTSGHPALLCQPARKASSQCPPSPSGLQMTSTSPQPTPASHVSTCHSILQNRYSNKNSC